MTEETEKKEYTVLVGCSNDETGKRHEIGDPVFDGDFDKAIIRHWLKKRVLKKAKVVK